MCFVAIANNGKVALLGNDAVANDVLLLLLVQDANTIIQRMGG